VVRRIINADGDVGSAVDRILNRRTAGDKGTTAAPTWATRARR
jgi:hypothetical protein